MSQKILSVLIPTIIGREATFSDLIEEIWKQIDAVSSKDEVEVLFEKDNKEITIGEKRGVLYKKANGIYSWQIDDDDFISPNAIELILKEAKENSDCITFEEYVDIDGRILKSNHSIIYNDWEGDGKKELSDGFHFHRTPFFKSVIKTDIAQSVPVVHCRFAEDHLFAQEIKPFLKNETHISQQIYKYIHRSSNHNLRYGIKQ